MCEAESRPIKPQSVAPRFSDGYRVELIERSQEGNEPSGPTFAAD
jgi:hypothetical protein